MARHGIDPVNQFIIATEENCLLEFFHRKTSKSIRKCINRNLIMNRLAHLHIRSLSVFY